MFSVCLPNLLFGLVYPSGWETDAWYLPVAGYFLMHVLGWQLRAHVLYAVFLFVGLSKTEPAVTWARLLVLSGQNGLGVGWTKLIGPHRDDIMEFELSTFLIGFLLCLRHWGRGGELQRWTRHGMCLKELLVWPDRGVSCRGHDGWLGVVSGVGRGGGERVPERLHTELISGQVRRGEGILTGEAQAWTSMQEPSQRCGWGWLGDGGAGVTWWGLWVGAWKERALSVCLWCGRCSEGDHGFLAESEEIRLSLWGLPDDQSGLAEVCREVGSSVPHWSWRICQWSK